MCWVACNELTRCAKLLQAGGQAGGQLGSQTLPDNAGLNVDDWLVSPEDAEMRALPQLNSSEEGRHLQVTPVLLHVPLLTIHACIIASLIPASIG